MQEPLIISVARLQDAAKFAPSKDHRQILRGVHVGTVQVDTDPVLAKGEAFAEATNGKHLIRLAAGRDICIDESHFEIPEAITADGWESVQSVVLSVDTVKALAAFVKTAPTHVPGTGYAALLARKDGRFAAFVFGKGSLFEMVALVGKYPDVDRFMATAWEDQVSSRDINGCGLALSATVLEMAGKIAKVLGSGKEVSVDLYPDPVHPESSPVLVLPSNCRGLRAPGMLTSTGEGFGLLMPIKVVDDSASFMADRQAVREEREALVKAPAEVVGEPPEATTAAA